MLPARSGSKPFPGAETCEVSGTRVSRKDPAVKSLKKFVVEFVKPIQERTDPIVGRVCLKVVGNSYLERA